MTDDRHGMGGASAWSSSPVLPRVALVATSAWACVGLGDIASAIAESRPDAWTTVITAVVVMIAALVSSVAGFAFAAIAGGALAYLESDPVSMVRTIVVCSFAIQLYGVWKLRASIRWRPVLPLLLGGMATLPIGVWLLVRLDVSSYATGLGLFLVAYGVYLLLRDETRILRGGTWTGIVAGALGGLTGGLAGLSGASVTIWCSMRGWDKHQQRAVYQPFILIMQLLTIACLHWHTPFDAHAAREFAFVPFAVIGAIGGLAVYQRLTNRQFQVATSALLLVSGAGLLARTL